MSQPRCRVLVVDDEAYIVQLVELTLSAHGFEIISACNGREALKKAASEKPNAIVLDINLPDMSGLEVCKQLKACEDTRMIPVLFLSAKSQKQDIAKGISAGAAAYISKPFQIETLVRQVRQILG